MKNYPLMSFPKREWTNVAKQLKTNSSFSSIRSCRELGKYKKGDIYSTPWGDKVKIVQVTRYSKAEDIPTWKILDKGMKISVRMAERYGNSLWDRVVFEKVD